MLKEFTEAQNEPVEKSTTDTYGAMNTGISAADISKGFIAEQMTMPATEEGDTEAGSIYEREGFLSPIGYKFNTR